jgi:hypothetical protein
LAPKCAILVYSSIAPFCLSSVQHLSLQIQVKGYKVVTKMSSESDFPAGQSSAGKNGTNQASAIQGVTAEQFRELLTTTKGIFAKVTQSEAENAQLKAQLALLSQQVGQPSVTLVRGNWTTFRTRGLRSNMSR